jgi:hypothetical protein
MLPFDFDSSDVDDDSVTYWNCQFTKDFGPFKDGEMVGCVQLWESKCTLAEYKEDGTLGRQCNVRLEAV